MLGAPPAIPRFVCKECGRDFQPTPEMMEVLECVRGKKDHRLDAYCARHRAPGTRRRWVIVSHG